jgi:muconolactone delta-isomerase
MSPASSPAATQTFVVVATIRGDADFAEMAALRADEEQRLEVLQSEGSIGAHHVSAVRRTVFLEVFAPDEEQAVTTLATLPFAKFFHLDVYPTAHPTAMEVDLGAKS